MAKSREDYGEDVSQETGDSLRVYELGFHIDPELPSEEVKKAYQSVRSLIEKQGTLVAEGEPVMVQLAYTISRQETSGRRDFNSAHFAWIVYEAPVASHDEVITTVAADTRIIRFIDVLTTKEAARHAAELREISLKASESDEDTETAAGAELDAALESATI